MCFHMCVKKHWGCFSNGLCFQLRNSAEFYLGTKTKSQVLIIRDFWQNSKFLHKRSQCRLILSSVLQSCLCCRQLSGVHVLPFVSLFLWDVIKCELQYGNSLGFWMCAKGNNVVLTADELYCWLKIEQIEKWSRLVFGILGFLRFQFSCFAKYNFFTIEKIRTFCLLADLA